MYRVLLVNDCKFENFIMRDMLISLGYEVIISNEFDAVSDARELNCNVIIANFIMKGQTGDEILQQVKHGKPEIRCILSSNNDLKLEDFNKKIIYAVIRTPATKEKLKRSIEENGQLLDKQKNQVKPSFCTYCGEQSDEGESKARFCKYCGEKYIF
ncbi:response regulator [Clostridium sp. CS001]|uniref:response regulator n=1 Tax=Clostridium sp. CS001 TaxID=2880648 RepID=UPI001CF2DE22|nr:response regulator [Clostridium sp. CS001]MCB2289114.1 response regulator [Clostridium sp. CS001]